MKKEYHYTISRTDRIYLVSFVIFLLGWELVKGFFPGKNETYLYTPKPKETFTASKDYKKNTYSKKYPDYKNSYKTKKSYSSKNNYSNSTPPDKPVSIMSASINELTSMGFSVKVAFNIHKYISSGGILSKPEELMKIYGMDSTQLLKVSPYIIYAPQKTATKEIIKKDSGTASKPASINLNTATAEELESMKGIGKVLAERIIKFRESMGGFIDPDQLKDCYGISPELFEELRPQLTVSGSPKTISINEADLTQITHPYFHKKMAKLIQAYKDQHGPIDNASELKKVYPADSNWFEKILPYISFDP